MSDERERIEPSRRAFLKTTALGAAAAVGLATGRSARAAADAESPSASPDREAEATGDGPLFRGAEREALTSLAEVVLPGAGAWGAAEYIERTLTLFEAEPPRLYAGTVGSTDEWLPFDRVREHAWRLRIHGSEAVPHPNEAVLGPLPGYRPVLLEGARRAAASLARGASPGWVWWELSSGFREVFTELVLEGSLGDPIYGGNRDGAAWRAFHFEGAMLGYGSGPYRPGLHAHDPARGEGPDPLGFFTRIALWVLGFFSRRIA